MRLWHYVLIKYLPRQQLIAQWRELNSIYVKQDKHILINYIYNYNKLELLAYSALVLDELKKRNYNYNLRNYFSYFCCDSQCMQVERLDELTKNPFPRNHNEEYLKICCWNLYEKYWRGQKGFTDEAVKFIKKQIGKEF